MSMMLKDLATALGVSAATVTRDAAVGMPTHSVDAAAAWRREHRRPRHRAQQPPEGATAAGPPQLPSAAPDKPDDSGGDYWASRARRERAEAELAELKLAEQQGVLIRADAVRAAHAKRLAGLREALLQVPARLAPVLAAETDQARCHDTLQREIHAVLASVVAA
jgi:hypothetical protein